MNRMKANTERKSNVLWQLLCLYIGTVLIRYALALITTSYPTIKIDEYLYFSLGRSIATKGALLYRGQPADYAFILYPLVISPVYLLFREGTDFYRLIQLWNIILMSSSVFPLYFLGRKMLGSEKKALAAAGLSMLVPDFILGEFIFSEAILFPLFFALMYCAYSYLEDGGKHWILWAGVIGGLLYSTKPGMVVSAAVFILFALGRAVKKKNGKDAVWCIGGITAFILTAALVWALARFVFGYQGGFLSVYEAQFDGTREWQFGAFLKNLAVYPAYFILACGITGILCPAVSWKAWKAERKVFWWLVIISLAVMIIGSAWALEQTEDSNNIQIRYVAMYMPMMLAFCMTREEKTEDRKKKGKQKQEQKAATGIMTAAMLTGYTAVFLLVFGSKAGGHSMNTHGQIALSLLNDRILPLSAQIWGSLIITLLCIGAFFLFLKSAGRKSFNTVCLWIMTGTMLINGVCGYAFIREFYSAEREKSGLAVYRLTEGKPYVYLLSSERVTDDGTDVNSKLNNCTVFINDFIRSLQDNNGTYVPYIPEKMRGMASVGKTPDVGILVADSDCYPFIEWNRNVTVRSPYDHGSIYVMQFTPGERIADSSLSNIRNRVLNPGVAGVLMLYDKDYMQKPFTIRMEIKSDTVQEMTINSTHEIYAVQLMPGEAWYEVAFKHAEEAFNIKVQNTPVEIGAYELVFAE